MAHSSSARTVHILFLSALLVLIAPAKLMATMHGAPIARVLGSTISTLLLWWLLYRLCMRARRKAWFVGLSLSALYFAAFAAPLYAWIALLAMTLLHRISQRFVPDARPPDPVAEAARASSEADVPVNVPASSRDSLSVREFDLDRISGSYRRFLSSQRVLRSATASLVSTVLLAVPVLLYFTLAESSSRVLVFVITILLLLFLGLAAFLYYSWMRALSRGSIMASRIGLLITGGFAVFWFVNLTTMFSRELWNTGEVWFQVIAYALQLSLLAAMGMGSAIVMLRRHDPLLIGLLRQNTTHGWRDAVLQLTGVIVPRAGILRASARKALLLTTAAFCVEGMAFYVYWRAASRFAAAPELLRFPYPGPATTLEGHYFALVTIACGLLPIFYVSTQMTLIAAERIRNAGRRAALVSAEQLLKGDQRPPVLFLRDFRDDQVSLDRTAMSRWLGVMDPSAEQLNLEDVMHACMSIGPVVAIGRPSDTEPPIGVARRYVQGDDWKNVVLSMMDSSTLIIVGVSESAGVAWEIDQLRDRGHLNKSVFVIPPTGRRSRTLIRQLASTLMASPQTSDDGVLATRAAQVIALRYVVGLTYRERVLTIFSVARPPSQVEFEIALRFARGAQEQPILLLK